ncbi:hypothetical protein HN958_00435 [Candidatus Falkowbacteria bacterium]|jgi:hypothetical protein|nr:hypothetical protein [Candidatus Falkowbacteria bacterium]MBT7006956.1 hypothetical protein [Candidatus Falkowbacteria bacterium]
MRFLEIFDRIANNCRERLNDKELMDEYRRDLQEKHPTLVDGIDAILVKLDRESADSVKNQVIFPVLYLVDLPSDRELIAEIERSARDSNEMAVAYSDYQMGGHPNINFLIKHASAYLKDDVLCDFLRSLFYILYTIYRCKKKKR